MWIWWMPCNIKICTPKCHHCVFVCNGLNFHFVPASTRIRPLFRRYPEDFMGGMHRHFQIVGELLRFVCPLLLCLWTFCVLLGRHFVDGLSIGLFAHGISVHLSPSLPSYLFLKLYITQVNGSLTYVACSSLFSSWSFRWQACRRNQHMYLPMSR